MRIDYQGRCVRTSGVWLRGFAGAWQADWAARCMPTARPATFRFDNLGPFRTPHHHALTWCNEVFVTHYLAWKRSR